MLKLHEVKKLSDTDLEWSVADLAACQEINARRLAALCRTQKRNPSWAYYDKYADDQVGIDTLIEMWEAVRDENAANLVTITTEIERRKAAWAAAMDYRKRSGGGASAPGSAATEKEPELVSKKGSQLQMF